MSKLDTDRLRDMMYSLIKDLREDWSNNPSRMHAYGIIVSLALLLYTIYNVPSKIKDKVDSGPYNVKTHICNKYKDLSFTLCNFRNDIAHDYNNEDFETNYLGIISRWDEVRELFDYLQDYVKARELLENRCKKYHIKDVVTETKTLLNKYCCDDIVELVVMMRADGTLTQ